MELRAGYKQTELGLIPQEWEVGSIGDTFRLVNGSAFKPVDWKQSGTPIIRIQNLNDPFAPFNYSQLPVPERNRVETGDLLFAWSGTIGTSFGARVWAGPSGVLNQHIFKVHIDERLITIPFALLVFGQVEEHIAKQAHGFKASFVHVKKADLVKVRLPIPRLVEQRAITATLSDVDGLLGGLDRLIAKKRDLKQAAMQQLLTGQTRLPGFAGEWVAKPLGRVADIKSGGTPSTSQPHFWDGDVPWCTPTDITALRGRKYLTNAARTISATGLQASSAEVIAPRSLIMTSRATIGECAINLVPMTTNQGFKNLVPFAEIDVEFLYYLMTTQKSGLIALCGGSTFLEIGKKQLIAYEVKLPQALPEQAAIATILSDMDTELTALESRRDKTRALKQAMMQELLTGRTRLV